MLLWQGGVVVDDVVDHRGISGLGGLPERRGGRNSKYIANRGNTKHDMTIRSAKRALTRYYTLQTKGGNIRG